jgi:hypothetical protein
VPRFSGKVGRAAALADRERFRQGFLYDRPMNILLWVVQVALAFLYFSGGAYKLFAFDELAKVPSTAALPRAVWGALGAFEILGAVLLIVPAAVKRMPALTPLAAAVLAVETLALAAMYATYSLELAATNPLVWCAAMGLLAAFVAYGRFKLSPTAR